MRAIPQAKDEDDVDENPAGIDPDICRATTLPPEVYTDPAIFERLRESVFARSWQLVGDAAAVASDGACMPITLLPGLLDEPLLFTRDQTNRLHCLSNVCTHRGALICERPGVASQLRCRYHGRRFELDGRFLSMPGFEEAKDFPRPEDDLPAVSFAHWRGLLFASVDPVVPFETLIGDLDARLGWLPIDKARLDPSRSRDYELAANWALWCDNFLEGFHIPFVHPSLAPKLDSDAYETEVYDWSSLQVGVACGDEDIFDPPAGSPDHGRRIAGYYAWLFPGTALNFYPWGLSINLVQPLAHDRTRIRYLTYVWDEARLERGAGAGLHGVELEDQEIVASAWRGVRSRFYRRSRYSPRHEACVHHFHRLLSQALGEGPASGNGSAG